VWNLAAVKLKQRLVGGDYTFLVGNKLFIIKRNALQRLEKLRVLL